MTIEWSTLLGQLPSLILQTLVLTGCILYLTKYKNGIAYTLVIGSGLALIGHLMNIIVQNQHLSSNYTEKVSNLYTIAWTVSGIGKLCFDLGFFLLMLNLYKKKGSGYASRSDLLDNF